MASAFAQQLAGDKIDAYSAGSEATGKINPDMEKVMAEKGIDMAFRNPQDLGKTIDDTKPDILVTMGCGEQCPVIPGCKTIDWDLPDPAGESIDFMREVRDKIENYVDELIKQVVN